MCKSFETVSGYKDISSWKKFSVTVKEVTRDGKLDPFFKRGGRFEASQLRTVTVTQ